MGDERIEDWKIHLNGVRRSLHPKGQYEDVQVERIALNRWHRARLDRHLTGLIQHQIDAVDFVDRESLDERRADLPEDEAAWFTSDPGDALLGLRLVEQQDRECPLPFFVAASFLTALERVTGAKPKIDGPKMRGSEKLDPRALTAGPLLDAVDKLAIERRTTVPRLLLAVELEIRDACSNAYLRSRHDEHRKAAKMTEALVPNDADLTRYMRYATHLDKELRELMRQLEVSQMARGGVLPPPVRLDIQQHETT